MKQILVFVELSVEALSNETEFSVYRRISVETPSNETEFSVCRI
jgi:hypothetical protein